MNIEKQRRKLISLMEKAQNALSRQESKEILKKVKKVAKKMSGKSEIQSRHSIIMASPLLAYFNGRIKATTQGTVSIVSGRPTTSGGTTYVVKCYIKRIQYSGVTSGSKPIPLASQLEGRMLPGGSGDQFYYRGFALQKAILGDSDWLGDLSGLTFTDITEQESFLLPGTEVEFDFGNEKTMKAKIERSSGQFGGLGIDEILYPALGGVEIQLTAADLQG